MAATNARTWLHLDPRLGGKEQQFVDFCRRVEKEAKRTGGTLSGQTLRRLRRELALIRNYPYSLEEIKLQLANSVALDLVAQTWKLKVADGEVLIHAPLQHDSSPALEKERVRKAHLVERDAKLAKRAVTEFIRGMERQRLTPKGWHSIFSLMRDGRDLWERLEAIVRNRDEGERLSLLQNTISPYIQFVEGDAVCEQTGLKLRDIWRYFRLTWVNEYKSVPGRSIMILIRDAAAPNHPVIGIAALGSSVVQQRIRDELIGWDAAGFTKRFSEQPSAKMAKQLMGFLQHLIDGIYLKDLVREKLLKKSELKKPGTELIESLRTEGKSARSAHQRNPHVAVHKSNRVERENKKLWERRAETMLFRSKRCLQLAKLLTIRKAFQDHEFTSFKKREVRKALESAQVRIAIGQLIRLVKAEHVGIDMMDITVCGALAPYNLLLGGKLVCLLLGSPEIVKYYARRYEQQPSIIASSMKGSPVLRRQNLVLLCTTSLYGSGSSQYNRIKVAAENFGGTPGEKFEYQKWGYSVGYGSFHFSQETMSWIKFLLGRQGNRRVNSIFGEGVNPLLRKIREALDSVGFVSDELLFHGNERVVYGIPLAANFREVLLGLAKRPLYIVPQSEDSFRTTMLAEYWRKRWLSPRILRPEILEAVNGHALTHPIKHGARVSIPRDEDLSGYLWDILEVDQARPY
jgi:hypothetical protein